MAIALFDTNIIIDYLSGYQQAKDLLEQHTAPRISIITKMEVLVGSDNENEQMIRDFLSRFITVELNNDIAEYAVSIRKEYAIKLPDAIIWASAKYNNCLLLTRNTKDFSSTIPDIKVPYHI